MDNSSICSFYKGNFVDKNKNENLNTLFPKDQNEISFYAEYKDIEIVNQQFVDQPEQTSITETIKALLPSCSIL